MAGVGVEIINPDLSPSGTAEVCGCERALRAPPLPCQQRAKAHPSICARWSLRVSATAPTRFRRDRTQTQGVHVLAISKPRCSSRDQSMRVAGRAPHESTANILSSTAVRPAPPTSCTSRTIALKLHRTPGDDGLSRCEPSLHRTPSDVVFLQTLLLLHAKVAGAHSARRYSSTHAAISFPRPLGEIGPHGGRGGNATIPSRRGGCSVAG